MQAIHSLANWLEIATCALLVTLSVLSRSEAQESFQLTTEAPSEILSSVVRRLDELELENQKIRNENALLLGEIQAGSPQSLSAKPSSSTNYTTGEGVTISMLDDSARLTLGATLSGFSTFITTRQFSPSLPLLLNPASPTGQDTNTFSLHARQSSIHARFTGQEFRGLKTGGEIYTLFFNDNITDDNYGLLVYFAYGELKNDQKRFAAGIQKDIFNPLGPTVLPISVLYASGNSGSYRGQIRWERFVPFENGSLMTFQVGLSEPIATLVRPRLVEPLAEYNAGVVQNFNTETFEPVSTVGGFGEIYYCMHPKFHLHCGYGIDDPVNSDLAAGQISSNQTLFTTAIWDISKNFQFGMEVDYRKTNYDSPLLDAEGVLVMNQFMWRF